MCTLSDLRVGTPRVHGGAILHLRGPAGLSSQLNIVQKYLEDFGLAAACGFGRASERPGRLVSDEGLEPPPNPTRSYLSIIVPRRSCCIHDTGRDTAWGAAFKQRDALAEQTVAFGLERSDVDGKVPKEGKLPLSLPDAPTV